MKKLKWLPSLSFKFGYAHLWAGSQSCDDRRIYLLLEELKEPRIDFKIHWLSDESPMFGIYLWPTPVLYFFWMHSHEAGK